MPKDNKPKPTFKDRAKGGKTRYSKEMKDAARRYKAQGLTFEQNIDRLKKEFGSAPSRHTFFKWVKDSISKPLYDAKPKENKVNKAINELREAVNNKQLRSTLPEETVLILQYLDDISETAYFESKVLAWRDKGQAIKAMQDSIQMKVNIEKDLTNQKLIRDFLRVVVRILNVYVPEKANSIQSALVPEILDVVKSHMGIIRASDIEVKAIGSGQ